MASDLIDETLAIKSTMNINTESCPREKTSAFSPFRLANVNVSAAEKMLFPAASCPQFSSHPLLPFPSFVHNPASYIHRYCGHDINVLPFLDAKAMIHHPYLPSASLPTMIGFHSTEEEKPSQSYIGLIGKAILSTPQKKLVLSDIYNYILTEYPYFRNKGPGWRNSIRHNLSLNECFIKVGRSPNGKGHFWAINPSNYEDFSRGEYRRKRANKKKISTCSAETTLKIKNEKERTIPIAPKIEHSSQSDLVQKFTDVGLKLPSFSPPQITASKQFKGFHIETLLSKPTNFKKTEYSSCI